MIKSLDRRTSGPARLRTAFCREHVTWSDAGRFSYKYKRTPPLGMVNARVLPLQCLNCALSFIQLHYQWRQIPSILVDRRKRLYGYWSLVWVLRPPQLDRADQSNTTTGPEVLKRVLACRWLPGRCYSNGMPEINLGKWLPTCHFLRDRAWSAVPGCILDISHLKMWLGHTLGTTLYGMSTLALPCLWDMRPRLYP